MTNEGLVIVLSADNKAAITGIKQVENSVDGLRESIKVYQDLAFNERDVDKLMVYNAELQKLETQLKQTTNIGKVGFDEMGVALNKSTFGFNNAIGEARRLQFVLRAVAGIGLFQVFSLAASGLDQLAGGIGKLSKAEEDAKKKMDGFDDTAARQLVQFQELTTAAADGNLPIQQRREAIEQLRKSYEPYLKNLSDEDILAGRLSTAYDKITKALTAKIALQALEEKVVPIIKQQLELQLKQNDLQKTIQAGATAAADAKVRDYEKITDADRKYFNDSRINARNAKEQYDKNAVALDELKRKIKTTFSAMKPFVGASAGLDLTGGKNGKDTDLTYYNELVKKLGELQKLYSDRRIDNDEYNKESNSAIDETLKKLDSTSKYYQTIIELQNQFLQNRKERGGLAQTIGYDKQNDFDATDKKKLTDGKDALIQPGNNAFSSGDDEKRKNLLELSKQAASAANELASAFTNAITSGQNMGDALTKVFEDLAKKIAQAAAEALIFSIILSAVPVGTVDVGEVSDATGGGQNSFGSIFKKLLGFASGGTVSGPASGYPVILHGTEHIVRPDQMTKIIGGSAQMGAAMGGGQGNIVVTGRISGNDIIMSNNRTNYSLGFRR